MASTAVPFYSSTIPKLTSKLNNLIFDPHVSLSFTATSSNEFGNRFSLQSTNSRKPRRNPTPPAASMIFPQNPVLSDVCATVISGFVALSVLRVWQETAKRRLCDQKLNRKLVHISIGLVFMLCWPLFSSGYRGAILAAITPGVNIIRMLLIGSGLWKDEATVKSMSRYGDYRELLKGPLYYATTITLACALYWRTSPIAVAAICNLCAGDGIADVVGRRFGRQKLPYNSNKSIAGSVAMATAGFLASVGFMYYFAYFGYIQESWEIVLGFLVVSLASALVESLPISTELDDNLTVTLTSILVGSLVF
ncbi:Phosphatidate cytidylyltransferase family protein isoform 3 [Theobroma cacao]|uniref:Phosphatidate cytidylyltransferase family protein isoform 3 n=1 Tax=Theobroma cacao TaxID=3641 RepID=A0A061GYK6_THECC|nr:Phosphatidate cytidylyltransferase family protein isoform 3 [Theobroma cacao]